MFANNVTGRRMERENTIAPPISYVSGIVDPAKVVKTALVDAPRF